MWIFSHSVKLGRLEVLRTLPSLEDRRNCSEAGCPKRLWHFHLQRFTERRWMRFWAARVSFVIGFCHWHEVCDLHRSSSLQFSVRLCASALLPCVKTKIVGAVVQQFSAVTAAYFLPMELCVLVSQEGFLLLYWILIQIWVCCDSGLQS